METEEEMLYWWTLSMVIDLIRKYGWGQIVVDLHSIDPTIFDDGEEDDMEV